MITKHKCKCGNSHIGIDDSNVVFSCGIVGLVDLQNVKIFDAKVECVKCNTIFYVEPKRSL